MKSSLNEVFSIYSNISDYMKTDYDVDGDQVLSQSLFPLSLKVTTKQKKFGTTAQRLESVSHATNQPTIEITFHRQKNYSMNSDFSVFS